MIMGSKYTKRSKECRYNGCDNVNTKEFTYTRGKDIFKIRYCASHAKEMERMGIKVTPSK